MDRFTRQAMPHDAYAGNAVHIGATFHKPAPARLQSKPASIRPYVLTCVAAFVAACLSVI